MADEAENALVYSQYFYKPERYHTGEVVGYYNIYLNFTQETYKLNEKSSFLRVSALTNYQAELDYLKADLQVKVVKIQGKCYCEYDEVEKLYHALWHSNKELSNAFDGFSGFSSSLETRLRILRQRGQNYEKQLAQLNAQYSALSGENYQLSARLDDLKDRAAAQLSYTQSTWAYYYVESYRRAELEVYAGYDKKLARKLEMYRQFFAKRREMLSEEFEKAQRQYQVLKQDFDVLETRYFELKRKKQILEKQYDHVIKQQKEQAFDIFTKAKHVYSWLSVREKLATQSAELDAEQQQFIIGHYGSALDLEFLKALCAINPGFLMRDVIKYLK